MGIDVPPALHEPTGTVRADPGHQNFNEFNIDDFFQTLIDNVSLSEPDMMDNCLVRHTNQTVNHHHGDFQALYILSPVAKLYYINLLFYFQKSMKASI